MSTRAVIAITNGDDTVRLYRHYDGYPDTVIPSIKEFSQAQQAVRAHDKQVVPYTAAAYLWWLKKQALLRRLDTSLGPDLPSDDTEKALEKADEDQMSTLFSGHGILPDGVEQSDAAYAYEWDLTRRGRVRYWSGSYLSGPGPDTETASLTTEDEWHKV